MLVQPRTLRTTRPHDAGSARSGDRLLLMTQGPGEHVAHPVVRDRVLCVNRVEPLRALAHGPVLGREVPSRSDGALAQAAQRSRAR
jgi:hypothetical protein